MGENASGKAGMSPVLPGHFLQGNALFDGDVGQVEHGHSQAFVLELLDFLLALEILQGRDVVDEFEFPLSQKLGSKTQP